MGIGGWISDRAGDVKDGLDAGGEWLEEQYEDGKEWVGETIDSGSEYLAEGLDYVGWESAADFVEETGDDIADSLGAEVDEMELGQTDDPKQLVHGEVERIQETITHLENFSTSMSQASSGLGAIEAEGWEGDASAGFEAKMSAQPGKWSAASESCSSAATALSDYSSTVTWAQNQARTAIDQYERGVAASREAVSAHNAKVDAWNSAIDAGTSAADMPPQPGTFTDPGTADIEAAQALLDQARAQRDEAGSRAASAITSATAAAPQEPAFTDRAVANLDDLRQMGQIWDAHLGAGLLKGTTSLVAFVRGINPTDPYNLRHPAEYLEGLSTTVAGLIYAGNNPVELVQGIIGDGWGTDPFEQAGELIPGLLGTKGLGNAGRGTRALDDIAETAARRGDDVPGVPPGRLPDARDIHHYDDVPTAPQELGRPPDPTDVSRWVDEVTEQYPELSRDEVYGLYDYTTNDGYGMNRQIREGTVDDIWQGRVNATRGGIDALPTYDGISYRGTNLPDHKIDELATGRYTEEAFGSSSLDPGAANNFIRPTGDNPTMFTIEGHSGVNVSPFSAYRGEAEILFRDGVRYDVLVNEVDANGIRQVVLRERE
jgi:hypothetical protein